ncbi:MAG: hypothetical protein IJY46_06630 [Lentisphaeria bacterium]|nr:hypothetical protein [Lentisphaeria bacterium]
MRKLLLTINIVLGVFLLWSFAQNISAQTKANAKNKLVKPVLPAKAVRSESKKKSNAPELPSLDDAVKKITAQDIFNNVRSPLANVRNSRTQLTLVGVFKIGKTEGAIIRQNTSQRQFNPYLAQMMSASGMMNRGGMGGGNRGGMMGGGRFTRWSQVAGRNSGAEKQYVKLGETLSNGYTLAEVTRTGVTLIRGNDRIELELQDPSKNRNSGRSNNNRRSLNSYQQFQQAQMIMQGQMMRTMQQIQRNIQSGGGNRGGGNRGVRR